MKIFNKKDNILNNEVDNFYTFHDAPAIFIRYIIHMLTFLISIYIVHLNFSILNAFIAMVLIIVTEIILEIMAKSMYARKEKQSGIFKKGILFIDRYYHYFILLFSTIIRLVWCFKLDIIETNVYINLLNCLLGGLITLLVYLLSKELFSKRAGQIMSLLYSFNVFMSIYCIFGTRQNIFAVLILFAMYILMCNRYNKINYMLKYLIVGLILSAATIIRIEGIIYLVSCILYLFLNSLIKNNKVREKRIGMAIILIIFLLVNIPVFVMTKKLDNYKEDDYNIAKSIEQFEINSKMFWNEINYSVNSDKIDLNKFKQFDLIIFLYCAINSAIIVIYCKLKNVEDERLYLLYVIICLNFVVFGFVLDNLERVYLVKTMLFILSSGCLAILKKGAETDAMKQNEVKFLKS